MVTPTTYPQQLLLKELELSALLEITQAINANLPEESLYRIYHFTLLANLKIDKLVLMVLDQGWQCKVEFGTKETISGKTLDLSLEADEEMSVLLQRPGLPFNEFDLVIPVKHKQHTLAYVFVDQKNDLQLLDTSFIQTLSNVILVAIENKKLARRQLEQESLKKEIEIARQVQSHLFPTNLPQTETLQIQAKYLPHQSIGGDYYDYIPLSDNKCLVCIADVSGKGIPAALLMSNVQASIRTMVRYTEDLKTYVLQLNNLILEHAKGEKFVTCFIAIIDFQQKSLQYVNCGHLPIPLKVEGKLYSMELGTTILGMFEKLPFINVGELKLGRDNVMLLYTDGVSECNNEAGEEYGTEPIQKIVAQAEKVQENNLIQTVIEDLMRYKGTVHYNDDVTFLSIKIRL
ncbi:MAG: PP2C family protein-serine/threonine phosphatase [Cytophagaceae bacterium]|jgi:sigma-B regulation protein RsbU (phosphoserine phosphatase)|nr:PP2C family protein-serine/threonine phosphatase [Cytophagaceae bacterium]